MKSREPLPKRERLDILYSRLKALETGAGEYTLLERRDETEDCRRALDAALQGASHDA